LLIGAIYGSNAQLNVTPHDNCTSIIFPDLDVTPITMVAARMTVWKYKSGQREKALDTLDEIMSIGMSGFRGDVILLSTEDPDSEVIITFWDDEEVMKASADQLFKAEGALAEPLAKLEKFLAGPPEITNYKVYSARAQEVTPEIARPV
jgi:heme-degrading monooxygenase HmoA